MSVSLALARFCIRKVAKSSLALLIPLLRQSLLPTSYFIFRGWIVEYLLKFNQKEVLSPFMLH